MNASLPWVRRAPTLLGGVAAGLLVLLVLGPSIRGWAAAGLVLAGAWTAGALVPWRSGTRAEPLLRVLARIQVAPRAQLALIETGGRRYLVSAGASVTSLPPQDGP
jgi:flagellar biosynthesis protein FliO